MSWVVFSIRVGTQSSLILFAWYLQTHILREENQDTSLLLNVFLYTSMSSFMLLMSMCGHFQCWLGYCYWRLRLWRCLACLLGFSQFRSSLLCLSTSISSLASSKTWYSRCYTFLMLPILPKWRLFRFSIRATMFQLPFPQGLFFSLFAHWSVPSISYSCLVSLKSHRRHVEAIYVFFWIWYCWCIYLHYLYFAVLCYA